MNAWPTGIAAITLFSDDLEASKAFYQKAFGLPIQFEDANSAVFAFGGTMVNLLRTSEAHDLIAPEPVGAAGSGARQQLTVEVDDIDARCGQLTESGVELLNGPMDRAWGIRTAAFCDPSGHVWEIAGPLRKE